MSTKPRVLFVDDDPSVLDDLARALRPEIERYDVMYALGSAGGIAVLREFDFDIVVTDLPAVREAAPDALHVDLVKPWASMDLRDLLARLTTAS